jgi:hypothetical protein
VIPAEDDIDMHFYSHLADNSDQDAYTTHEHMKVLVKELLDEGVIKPGSTMWDETDGCMKQYRSGNAMYLLTVLAAMFDITIDRAIGAPGHGKDLVDGLNATDKRYLKELFKMLLEAEDDSNANSQRRMEAHAMTNEGEENSLAVLAAEKLGDPSRSSGVKGDRKHAKREGAAKMTQRKYHVQKPEDVMHRGIKKVAKGFEKGPHNGIMGHYNLCADPKLGVGTIAVRRVPCLCVPCRAQLNKKWDPKLPPKEQPRYAASTDCELHEIFQDLNNWKIIQLLDTNESILEENDEVHELVLKSIAERLQNDIEIGGYGAVMTDDPDADGYYVLEWDSKAYQLEQDLEQDQMVFAKGDWVVEGIYLNRVPRAKQWYTKAPEDEVDGLKTIVRLQHVVAVDLTVDGESENQELPRNCDRRKARELGALHISDDEHDEISDEIARRDRLDFLEEVVVDDEPSSSDSESEEEEEEEA